MKLSFFLITVFALHLSASTYSQTKRLTIDESNVSIAEIFRDIDAQSRVSFLYSPSEIDITKNVSVKGENVLITDILASIFTDKDIAYQINDKHIVLFKPDGNSNNTGFTQQSIAITGRVTDEAGEPLPGVNVIIQGTSIGVITDANGKYSITAPNTGSVLQFSYIGYVSQEYRVGNQTVVDIIMKENTQQIDEVVVVGYGTQKKSNVTGSIISVKPDVYKDMNTGVTEIIQGRVAGVNVNNGDIIIRGAASINGSGPLWIVDGIPGGAPNFNDIQSIEILKDGASTAIYGARGAGGVILVTTKRGISGKTQINFKANMGVVMPINIPNTLNTKDFINRKLAAGFEASPTSGWDNPASLPDTRWNDLIWGNAFVQNYYLQLIGGNENNRHTISADYHYDNSVSKLRAMDQGGGIRAVLEQKLSPKFKVTEILSGGTGNSVPSSQGLSLRPVPTMAPYDPANESGGGWGKQPPGGYYNGQNPLSEELINHFDNRNYWANAHLIFDWEIIKGLSFQANLSGGFNSWANNHFKEAYNWGTLSSDAIFEKDYGSGYSARMFYTLTYDHTFAEKHYIKGMAGYEANKDHNSNAGGWRRSFPIRVAEDMKLGTGEMNVVGGQGNGRGVSQFARLDYAFDSKYLLEGNIRRDGYDNFGPDNRYGIFPSASVGWNLHRESFIADNLPVISLLKLRAGYGVIGNNTIPQFTYESVFTNDHMYYSYDGSAVSRGFRYGKVANTGIKWEQVAQFDVGVDAGFLNNRLNFSAEYYTKKTTNMLYWIALPISSGAWDPTFPANIGEISNKGVDLMIQYRDSYRDFRYDVAFTMSTNNNKVIKLSEEINPIIWKGGGWTFNGQEYRTENGYPMGQIYGFKVDGIFQTQSEIDALNSKAPLDADGKKQFYQFAGTAPGDLKYHDTNGDGIITEADKQFIGNPWPKLIYGLNINLSWKNFDLVMGWFGNYKFDIFNDAKAYERSFYGDYNTTYKVYDAWTSDKATGNPRVTRLDPNGNFKNYSSYFVEDGSFLKLKSLHFGYNIPSSLLKNIKIEGLKLFVNCNNMFTFTKFQGDPEIGGGYLERNTYGSERFPAQKSVLGGISLTF